MFFLKPMRFLVSRMYNGNVFLTDNFNMNNVASIESDSFSSSDDLPSLSRPKTSTPNATDHEQRTGLSVTGMPADEDENTLQLVIEVIFHHNEKTYREWYPNNAKAEVSSDEYKVESNFITIFKLHHFPPPPLWRNFGETKLCMLSNDPNSISSVIFLIQTLLKYISDKLDKQVLLQCGEHFINPDERVMALTSGSTLDVNVVVVQK